MIASVEGHFVEVKTLIKAGAIVVQTDKVGVHMCALLCLYPFPFNALHNTLH